MLMDWAGLSSLRVCVREREKKRERKRCYKRLCLHTYLPLWVSVCTISRKRMNMHVCVHAGSDVLPRQRPIAPWWAITGRLDGVFPYISVYGSVAYKKCVPYSEVAPRSFLLIDRVFLICLDTEEGGRDSGKVLESSRSAAAANSCSLCTYRICAAWSLLHQGVCMDVINRDLGWIIF